MLLSESEFAAAQSMFRERDKSTARVSQMCVERYDGWITACTLTRCGLNSEVLSWAVDYTALALASSGVLAINPITKEVAAISVTIVRVATRGEIESHKADRERLLAVVGMVATPEAG